MTKKYFILTLLLAAVVSPLLLTIFAALWLGLLSSLSNSISDSLLYLTGALPPVAALVLVWRFYFNRVNLPDTLFARLLPIVLAFSYYMLVWIVLFALAGYRLSDMSPYFLVFTLPYAVINVAIMFDAKVYLFPLVPGACAVLVILTGWFTGALRFRGTWPDKRLRLLTGWSILLALVAAGQYGYRTATVFSRDTRQPAIVVEENDMWAYAPFIDDNKLQRPSEPPTLTIDSDYPRLDGATAAYPVYAAMAQALYKNIDPLKAVDEYVTCHRTERAYERLIDGHRSSIFSLVRNLRASNWPPPRLKASN